ncbi:MAG: exosortase/archaeosortase family protein [Planctomycetota bacterium]
MAKNRGSGRRTPSKPRRQDSQKDYLRSVVVAVLLGATLWAYWPTVTDLLREWNNDDNYSAGQLVPLVALFLLWRERKTLAECVVKPCWWGIGLVMLALAARTYGLLFIFQSAERYSLALMMAALVLMVAGWKVFRSVFWILLMLFLMVPFPGRVHNMISGPLQSMATTGAVFILEAFIPVSQEGNLITLPRDIQMNVAEACSGLRMLTAFIIVAAFMAYMVKRARWQKATLLLSSVPVAVMCNIIRLCATAVLFLLASKDVAQKFFHDFAGIVMMPAAVLLMFAELWLMNKLTDSDSSPPQGGAGSASQSVITANRRSRQSKKGA